MSFPVAGNVDRARAANVRFTLPAAAQTLLDNLATGGRWIFKAARATPTGTPVELSPDPIDGGGEVSATLSVTNPVALTPDPIDGGGAVSAALSVTTPTGTTVALTPAAIEGGGGVSCPWNSLPAPSTAAASQAALTVATPAGTPVELSPAAIDGGGELFGALRVTLPPAVGAGLRLEIDGRDVSDYPGVSAVVDQEVGQRSTARVALALVEGAELPGGGVPADFDRVRIEHPGQPYRSVALGLDPWLYWPLDDGPGQSAADDISGNDRPGTWAASPADVTRRAVLAETAPVPYGAAPWIGDANPAIQSDDDTSAIGVDVTVALFLRIDTAAAGTVRTS